jgi:hypothetical protein
MENSNGSLGGCKIYWRRREVVTNAQLVAPDWRNGARTPLNYSGLAPDVADEMRDHADRIHNIQQASVLNLGRELIAAKELVEHGFFRNWAKNDRGPRAISPLPARRAQRNGAGFLEMAALQAA